MATNRMLIVCMLGWLLVGSAVAQKPIREALQKEGYTHFLQLASAAGIEEPKPNAVLTIFAPTNKAIDEFLGKMKLSLDDMKNRPSLAAAVVGYTVLPRVKGRASDVKGATKDQPVVAITADDTHFLKFHMEGDKVKLEDVQNNTANLLTQGTEVGNTIFYGIDRVLLSGDVFLTLDDLLSVHPQFIPLRKLYVDAGLQTEVQNMSRDGNSLTVFAPTAEAVKASQSKLAALSKPQLQDVLRYHIVPAALPIPTGLKADTAYPTAFKGHTLKFKYNKVMPSTAAKGSSNSTLAQRQQEEARQTVEIVPEAGTFGLTAVAGFLSPKVTIANLFANRMVIHGINQILKPDFKLSQQPQDPKTSTEAAAAAKASQPQTASTATTTPTKPAAGGSTSSGRKLLQWRQGAGASSTSVSMTSAQSSIRAAVEGRASVSDATAAGSDQARFATARCLNCGLSAALPGGL